MCLPVEPFKIEREWEHSGLQCAVVQNHEGRNRCGYVRVPPGHPLHGADDGVPDVDVHGGLTFAAIEPCVEHDDGQGYWFGFDCAHCTDTTWDPAITRVEDLATPLGQDLFRIELKMRKEFPGLRKGFLGTPTHYWTQAEVEQETERLAEQLSQVAA